MTRWFAGTMFVAAFLLFLVQPMVGKSLLPHVGGAPAVWNTCMMFFQVVLLAGYAYAHFTARTLGLWKQIALHAVLVVLPAAVLPISIPASDLRASTGSEFPVLELLQTLTLRVGLPFFVVAATAPLLQQWFAQTRHESARDPYFLYAASNLGSLLALAAYPAIVEPWLGLSHQGWLWTCAYVLFGLLIASSMWALTKARPLAASRSLEPIEKNASQSIARVSNARRARWGLLAFVPSSLLLGVTVHISTDIAPIPLLWIVPLALYLLTFIFAFARRQWIPLRLVKRILPIFVLILALVFLSGATALRGLPVGVLLSLHLITFFLAALMAHGELARDRPGTEHLTEFYLWLSLGGVLGGVFNAILAPLLFSRTGLTEYPLALVLACLLRSDPITRNEEAETKSTSSSIRPWDFLLPVALGALTLGLIFLSRRLSIPEGPWRAAVMFGVPCIVAYTFVDRPWRFGLGIALLLIAGALAPQQELRRLERNFFGVLKVAETQTETGRTLVLYHGNTVHGEQSLDRTDDEGRHEPRTYYHRKGPIGAVCQRWLAGRPPGRRVGVVGLGTGSLAYYARPGDEWTFYEIDPAVDRVARNDFAFLNECRGTLHPTKLGDARIRLREEADHSFDLLVLDAFSSDAIPVHLLTREALSEYLRKLKPDGILAFHVSNRYLHLPPIVARLAEHQDPPLVVRGWDDVENRDIGKSASQWLVVAANDDVLKPIMMQRFVPGGDDPFWRQVKPTPATPLWTDDFTNILRAIAWGERDELP